MKSDTFIQKRSNGFYTFQCTCGSTKEIECSQKIADRIHDYLNEYTTTREYHVDDTDAKILAHQIVCDLPEAVFESPNTNNFFDLQDRIFSALSWADNEITCDGCDCSRCKHNPICQLQHDLSASLGANGKIGIINPHPSVLA